MQESEGWEAGLGLTGCKRGSIVEHPNRAVPPGGWHQGEGPRRPAWGITGSPGAGGRPPCARPVCFWGPVIEAGGAGHGGDGRDCSVLARPRLQAAPGSTW